MNETNKNVCWLNCWRCADYKRKAPHHFYSHCIYLVLLFRNCNRSATFTFTFTFIFTQIQLKAQLSKEKKINAWFLLLPLLFGLSLCRHFGRCHAKIASKFCQLVELLALFFSMHSRSTLFTLALPKIKRAERDRGDDAYNTQCGWIHNCVFSFSMTLLQTR